MPRKHEPSFELKTIIWDIAATVGQNKPTAIQRQLEYELEKRRKEGSFFESTPDVRTISSIVEELHRLPPEVVAHKLPIHVWKLRSDYETINIFGKGESETNTEKLTANQSTEKPKQITDELKLEEHFYELETMAIRLADTIEGILVHKDRVGKRYSITLVEGRHYSCIKFCGNIIDGGSISEFDTDESGAVIESTMIPFESTDVIWKPVDSFTATCLLEHLKNRFPDVVPFKDWRELSHDNVSPRIVDKLRLLAHFKNFSVCPTCPICKDLQL